MDSQETVTQETEVSETQEVTPVEVEQPAEPTPPEAPAPKAPPKEPSSSLSASNTELEARVEEKLQRAKSVTEVKTTESTEGESAAGEANSGGRGDVSASTVARMMGLATASELSMLEGKLDLLSSRVGSTAVKLERIFSLLERMPTGTDLDRIDVNIGSLKTLIRESLERIAVGQNSDEGGDAGKLKSANIMSNSDEDE